MAFVRFKLLDRKTDQSSFFQNQDGTKDYEKKLDFTNTRGVLNPFYVIDGKTGGRQLMRYIQGCSFFEVERQDKEKIIANFQNSTIQFEKGADIILDESLNKPLIEFLKMHPFNPGTESKPNKNHNPLVHNAVFVTVDPADELKKELEEIDLEDQAMDIYRALIKSPERMRLVATLFAETRPLPDDKEIQIGLRTIAKERPQEFIDSLANNENKVLADVLIAQKINVITRNAKGFIYEGKDGEVILPTTAKDQAANKLLVDYYLTKDGQAAYENLVLKIAQRQLEMDSPAGRIEQQKAATIE